MPGKNISINKPWLSLGVAITLNLLALISYCVRGFSYAMVLVWLVSLVLAAGYFYLHRIRVAQFWWRDLLLTGILGVIFTPLYLFRIYTVPWQVGSDEVSTMVFEQQLASSASSADWFGLAGYFHFPIWMLLSRGLIGKLLGGITLAHMRTLSAFTGVLIVLAAYFFFRLFYSRQLGLIGAVLIGSQHALLAVSRMAMGSNVALLHEIIALTLLLRGFLKRSFFATFLGGVISGLAFYHYFPGRMIIGIWGFFLLIVPLFYRKYFPVQSTIKLGLIAMLGFIMTIGPIAIATFRAAADPAGYEKQQILIFREARDLQKVWVGAENVREGILINLKQGLTVFNNNLHDFGYQYHNPGHGFVDPVTGILIWIGFMIMLKRLRQSPESALVIVGFSLIFLFYAFLTTKNPNYVRFLIVLPFSTALVVESLYWTKLQLDRLLGKTQAYLVLVVAAGIIAFINLGIYRDYVRLGNTAGNDIGATARYIEARQHLIPYSFYLVADQNNPYYSWGGEGHWSTWIGFFASPSQYVQILTPDSFVNFLDSPPFSIFMPNPIFQINKFELSQKYPGLTIYPILPDASLVAVEVD